MNHHKPIICLFLILLTLSSCSHFTSPPKLEIPEGWTSDSVAVNGVRLRYYRTGGSLPPLVLSHGFTDHGLSWTALAHALEKDYDVIMYDIRGHGYSEAPKTGYTMADHVADLAGLIRALKLKRPIILGHSLGACIAAALAAQYPQLPQKVILEDPPGLVVPYFRNKEAKQQAKTMYQNDIKYLKGMSRSRLLKEAAKRHPNFSPADRALWADSKMLMNPAIAETALHIPFVRPDIVKIKIPTLVMMADADKTTRQVEVETFRSLPNIRVVHIDHAGHNIHREQPEAALAVIRNFLKDVNTKQE